jgi:ubiquinone/menaquinone biosynthesis C-methylase UbiE
MRTRQEFFGVYLRDTAVSHALWRCYECERFAKEKLKGPVLDLGCGDGYFAQVVFGHLDVGIDLDRGEVGRAVKRGTYDKALVVSATKMPFKNNTFNTVISNCVMEHIPDIDGVLSEVYRVLKPGGRLITSVPSEYWDRDSFYQKIFDAVGFNQASQWYNRVLNKISKHYHVNDFATWNERFNKAGLKLQKSEFIVPLAAYHTFERWLITGSLSKIWKALFNRWVLLPRFWAPAVFNWWFKDLLKAKWTKGACYYFVVTKPMTKPRKK